MKVNVYAPRYFNEFNCIADKCKHSCCIGWEILIDESALIRYKKSPLPYADNIKKSISNKGEAHFKLLKGDRCPHLNSDGLCRIILECGEDYLCDICRLHPRFCNETARGREVGLGMSCEAAAKLILTSDYTNIIEIGEEEKESISFDFDAIAEREKIFPLLSDKSKDYDLRLKNIRDLYGISFSVLSFEGWQRLLSELEYLEEENRRTFKNFTLCFVTPSEFASYLEHFLGYMIYRHTSSAENKYDFITSLGFCLFCERLLTFLLTGEAQPDVFDLARRVSSEIEYSEDNTDRIKSEFM